MIKYLSALLAVLLFLGAPALASEDLFKRDWSVTGSDPLAKYPPAPEDIARVISETLNTDWNMHICSFKFIDVYDGDYRLVALIDSSGRHECNRLVVIEKGRSTYHAVNDWPVLGTDDVGDMLSDLDGDHSPELIITQSWSRPERGHCTAVWQRILKWHSDRFADESASYPQYYQAFLHKVQADMKQQPDPVCGQMEIDKIARFTGAPTAGFDQAVAWSRNPEPSLRRKAAAVFADIGDDASRKALALMIKDDDPLTAENARLYLENAKPKE